MLDLSDALHAYIFGLFQTDGSLSDGPGNKGKFQLEINIKDISILEKITPLINHYSSITTRTRKTNFISESTTAIFCVCDKRFRDNLKFLGLPAGKKSAIISEPSFPHSRKDYFRGIIDGDGSLGITAKGFPFLSLCTTSEKLAINYMDYIKSITGKDKKLQRNKRDSVYNICITKEDAQKVIAELYYTDCLCLDRKMKAAYDVLSWVRPTTMKRKNVDI